MQVLNTNLETAKIYQGTTLRVFTPCNAICTVTNELPNECTNPETTLPVSMNINLDSSNLSSSQMQELKCFLASFSDMLSTPTGALGQTSVVKHDVVRLIATLSISGELIVSKYVAESITLIAGCFDHVGLCQLRSKLKKLQCETCYIANTGQWCCVMKSGCVNDQ